MRLAVKLITSYTPKASTQENFYIFLKVIKKKKLKQDRYNKEEED